MPHLPSLAANATLADVFARFPATSRPLLDYHEVLLRGPSPFTVAERELIAAYVSGLNRCRYCHGVHTRTAEAFGVDEGLLADLVEDLEGAAVDAKLKPVLAYVRKLTETPSRMTEADARAVFDAGWDETALHDAVSVCALFNLMNRLVEGLGLADDPGYAREAGRRLHDQGYAGIIRRLGL